MKNPPEKILIREPNWLGDNIFTLPAVRRLRELFPEARLTVLVRCGLGPLWEMVPEVDEVIVYDLRGGWRDLKRKRDLVAALRKRGFDLAVIFPRSFESALWTRLAGIPHRWGYAEEGRSLLLTRAVRSSRGYRNTHRIDYYYRLIGGEESSRPASPARLVPSDDLLNQVRELLREETGYGGTGSLIGFHPRASYGPAKCWPLEKFARLAELLVEKTGASVLLFGSKKERGILRQVVEAAGAGVFNLAGKTNLKELGALIKLCRVFVANDSGPLHLAAALGVPVVGIYGSTAPAATGPRGRWVRIIYRGVDCSPCLKRICPTDFKCMEEITPEEVMDQVEDLLAQEDLNLAR